MATLNKYVRVYKFEEKALIYNTINGKIVILPIEGIMDSVMSFLIENYFLERDLPWGKYEERFESNNRLLISLETFLACNLSCPYCYQINNNHPKTKISIQNLDLLFEYITQVYQKVHLDILILKVLGGEPSLDWSPADYLLKKIVPFCNNNHIKLELRIDTNCVDIRQFLSITGYNSILFTIPLCNKTQHDKYRHYKNGSGTYEDIIKNVIALGDLHNSHIVLRHNTDANNIVFFNDYLDDLYNKGIHNSIVMPQYTTNPDYGSFKNHLTYQMFVDWLSSEYINAMVKHNFKIPIYPRLLLDGKCQQWSKYSLKLFSDGRVGACAAHFFDTSNPYLSEIMDNGIESILTYWNSTKSNRLFSDVKCRTCKSFFGCSGHYKLPCIRDLKITPYKPEENLYLNWPLYFQTVLKFIDEGKQGLFSGLNITSFKQ